MTTKKELRTAKRKEKLIVWAEHQQVYCHHPDHDCHLNPSYIKSHHCYSGNHGSRYCDWVEFPGGNREGKRKRKEIDGLV